MVRIFSRTEVSQTNLEKQPRVFSTSRGHGSRAFYQPLSNNRKISFALAFLLSTTVIPITNQVFAGQTSQTIQLRGSDSVVTSTEIVSIPRATDLRGPVDSTVSYENVTENTIRESSYDNSGSGFMSDMGSALLYLRDNVVPVVMFRGSTDAVSQRNVTYTIPDRGILRNSMMHSANIYEGLRGSAASVGDTVATALRGSYSARAKLERANLDRVRVHGALANYLPKITGTIDANTGSSSLNSTNGSGGRVVTGGIEVTMPLFTSGVNFNTYKQALHTSRASQFNYLAEEHRVALEAVTAHVNLRLNRRIETTLRSNVNAMQRIANIARKLFAAGDASRTDIAIADANVQSARAELDMARRSREETQVDYESITGKHAPARLTGLNIKSIVPASLEEAVDMAVRYNPVLASSLHVAQASKHAAKVERGRFGPQVNLYGNYDRDLYRSLPTSNSEEWRVGVRLRVPLFDATLSSSVNAARHEALENGYRALDQSRLIERQIERQWSAYHSAARRTKIVGRQVTAIGVSVTGARREFQAGFRSISEVLTDQIKLARAKITLETARHERMLAAYELAFTMAHPALQNLAEVRGVTVSR